MPEQEKIEVSGRKIWGLHSNVFFMGLCSLLNDISSEMIFTLVPLFIANVLGGSALVIGLIGGLSESTDAIFRIFSGRISDRVGRRKPLAALGYVVSTVAKPFMYLASNWGVVLAVRFTDRIGKGVRTSPRDALVADFLSKEERGRGFGVHRAMDSSGAVLGLALAAFIIYHLQGGALDLGLNTFRWLVLVGIVPAVLAVLVLLGFVRERKRSSPPPSGPQTAAGVKAVSFDARFKIFLVILAIFTLGNSSEFFVVLRAQNLGAPVLHVTLMLVLFNIAYVAFSVPAGILSDKLGRRRVIMMGWAVYALVYLGFAVATSLWQVWVLFAGYGVYHGIVGGAARAFVADLVTKEKRGTAYGIFHGVVGITLLPASVLAGWLWQAVGPAAAFYLGAALALIATAGLFIFIREPAR